MSRNSAIFVIEINVNMGKNRKQQAAYDYVHDNKEVKGKMLRAIMNMWWRHNGDVAEERKYKKELLTKEYFEARDDRE